MLNSKKKSPSRPALKERRRPINAQSVVEIAPWGAVRFEDFTLHNGGAAQWASSPRKPPINQLASYVPNVKCVSWVVLCTESNFEVLRDDRFTG